MIEYTPEIIYKLEPNEIIVFSSSLDGKHNKGVAKFCFQKFGAIYGQAEGLQGQSYAVIAKKVNLSFIREQVEKFYNFCKQNENLKFYVTKIGCDTGCDITDIGLIFMDYDIPQNVVLPKEFYDWTKM